MAIGKISRRAVVSGLGAGLVDPTTKYPRPPFEGQQQEWPGLAGKMDPRPDHGEKSYKGSMWRSIIILPRNLMHGR